MHRHTRDFVPAAGHDFALPLYDPLTRLFGADAHRRRLIAAAGLQPGDRVLDVGCGTGTLAIAAKRLCPGADIIGVDPDPRALARARAKAQRARVAVRFEQGYGDALPYAASSFEHVFSSFMLHHLAPAAQLELVREAARVLVSGGALHLIDFVHAAHGLHGFSSRSARAAHRERIDLPATLQRAGFADVREEDRGHVFFQRVAAYGARRLEAA